jgi:polygalacturonase
MLSRGARSAIGAGTVFDVRSFGAVGDGKNLDSPAINQAIKVAGAKGGAAAVLTFWSLRDAIFRQSG